MGTSTPVPTDTKSISLSPQSPTETIDTESSIPVSLVDIFQAVPVEHSNAAVNVATFTFHHDGKDNLPLLKVGLGPSSMYVLKSVTSKLLDAMVGLLADDLVPEDITDLIGMGGVRQLPAQFPPF